MVSNWARTESMISGGVLRGCSFQSSVSILLPMMVRPSCWMRHDGRGLVVGVRLLVDVVGRAEIERLHAQLALEQALGEIDLQIQLARGDFADVGMRIGVIADLVAFADDALHEADVVRGLGADQEEGAFDVFLLQDVENLRRPLGIGAVVEGERKLIGMVAVLLDGVGARIHIHVLVDDELLARVGLVGIHFYGALAGLRQAGDAQNVAVALGVHVVAGLHGAQRLQRIRIAGLVPDVPERAVFLAQAPQGKGLQAELAARRASRRAA